MPEFIELTAIDGTKMWINMNQVSRFTESDFGSKLYMGERQIVVKEKPRMIIHRLYDEDWQI